MPPIIQVRTHGQVRAKLQSFRTRLGAGVQRGIDRAALFLLRESQAIVPVDTGALRASGRVATEGEGITRKALVVYGTGYGVYVHEDLYARHAPGKSAKFLERPAREKVAEIKQIIADECRRERGA